MLLARIICFLFGICGLFIGVGSFLAAVTMPDTQRFLLLGCAGAGLYCLSAIVESLQKRS